MLTRSQKEEHVAALQEKLRRATSVYVTDYRGIDVQSVNQLRQRIHSEGHGDFEYRVIKNTVARRASEGAEVSGLLEHFGGPSAVAFSYGDPVGLAKILVDFSKEHASFSIKGGLLEGRAVDSQEIGQLATLPSLEALRGRIIGLLQAPMTKLARLLGEPGAQLARVIDARSRPEGA